jgi:hypothetical protein
MSAIAGSRMAISRSAIKGGDRRLPGSAPRRSAQMLKPTIAKRKMASSALTRS